MKRNSVVAATLAGLLFGLAFINVADPTQGSSMATAIPTTTPFDSPIPTPTPDDYEAQRATAADYWLRNVHKFPCLLTRP